MKKENLEQFENFIKFTDTISCTQIHSLVHKLSVPEQQVLFKLCLIYNMAIMRFIYNYHSEQFNELFPQKKDK